MFIGLMIKLVRLKCHDWTDHTDLASLHLVWTILELLYLTSMLGNKDNIMRNTTSKIYLSQWKHVKKMFRFCKEALVTYTESCLFCPLVLKNH